MNLPVNCLKPDPQFYLKKGMGNGGNTYNKTVMLTEGATTSGHAFEKFGINAKPMAEVYNLATKMDMKNHVYPNKFYGGPRTQSIDTTISDNRETYYPQLANMMMTPGSIETTGGSVSHKRYNTITMRNEDALRPGIQLKNTFTTQDRHGTAPD